MTEDWLREMYDTMILGAILLDFSAAFDIIDHILLEKRLLNQIKSNQIKFYLSHTHG